MEIGYQDMDAAKFARVRLGFEQDERQAEILRSGEAADFELIALRGWRGGEWGMATWKGCRRQECQPTKEVFGRLGGGGHGELSSLFGLLCWGWGFGGADRAGQGGICLAG